MGRIPARTLFLAISLAVSAMAWVRPAFTEGVATFTARVPERSSPSAALPAPAPTELDRLNDQKRRIAEVKAQVRSMRAESLKQSASGARQ